MITSQKERLYNAYKEQITGKVYIDEEMRYHTTLRVGGPVDLYLEPQNLRELRYAVCISKKAGYDYQIVGNGSNLLIADEGLRSVVIRIGPSLSGIQQQGNTLTVRAGTMLPELVHYTSSRGLSGLEFAAGIPATAGGAVCMNAGGSSGCMADVVERGRLVLPDGSIVTCNHDDLDFGYRTSSLQDNGAVLCEVKLSLLREETMLINKRVRDLLEARKRTQPLSGANAGSIFKNPPRGSAGKIIEECGGKELRRGGARVSTSHANFIVNDGSATANDIHGLIRDLQHLVYDKCSIELEPEIRILGF